MLEDLAGTAVSAARSASPPEGSEDIVSRLERLDRLHGSGALEDTEYEAAKEALLREEGNR